MSSYIYPLHLHTQQFEPGPLFEELIFHKSMAHKTLHQNIFNCCSVTRAIDNDIFPRQITAIANEPRITLALNHREDLPSVIYIE